MVTKAMMRLGAALAVAAGIVVACKVPNPDHCANQDLAGNAWCARHYEARTFCSPCRASYNGCVEYEPRACGDYRRDDEDGESSTGGDPDESGSTT